MVRAIEKIKSVPSKPDWYDHVRQFLVMALYTLTYSPDRESTGAFGQLRREFEEYFGKPAQIELALETKFFLDLYVDRREKQQVKDLIPAMRPVLIHGHIGVGKTVVLRKIELESREADVFRLIYFDLKAEGDLFDESTPGDFDKKFRDYVYGHVYKTFIENSSSYLQELPIYKVRFDEGYASFRQWVLEVVQRPLRTHAEWQEVLEMDIIKPRWQSFLITEASHETLLSFLKEKFTYALCFDNIDRHPIKVQRWMLSKSIDISNKVQVPVLVAIREPNLRRLRAEGAEGDFILSDYFERLRTGEEKAVSITNLENATVGELLSRRLEFADPNYGSNSLRNLFTALKDRIEFDFEEFKMRFRDVLEQLAETFVDEDAYSYCSHNLRELLVLYFKLISKLLLNPEEEYSLYKLLPQRGLLRRTQLRTFFYKWLICGDAAVPKATGGPINIYRDFEMNLSMLNLRILEFLYNWEGCHPDSRLEFDAMVQVFHRFGVTGDMLEDRLEEMTRFQDLFELSPIWIDRHKGTEIEKTTRIELMPMGKYFIRTLSTSREYAFWNALTADLAEAIVDSTFSFDDTHSDAFKLGVVYKFVKKILVPVLEKEIEYFDVNLHTPRNWHDSNLQYFKRYFSIGGHFYPDRLLNSVMDTIPFTALSGNQKREQKGKFLRLLRKVEKIERYLVPS